MYLSILFKVIGGLGLFLYGMNHLSLGMQKIAGDRLKRILALLTGNRVTAVIVGVVITALVQSSSVSTVMTIGFVNASLLTLKQAVGVVLGANIGSTISGWILVLKIGIYGLPITGAAAIAFLFCSNEKAKTRALTIMGLGLIFLGLEIMSEGMKPVRSMPEFIQMFHSFDAAPNGILHYSGIIKAALVGMLLTAIVQSSAATLGITIALTVQGLLNYETAVALVLGENVGTTITAILASFKGSANAKRAAYAHTFVNLVGVCWVITIFPFYIKFLSTISDPVGNVTKSIAIAHSMFNVLNVCLFIPFIGPLSKALNRIGKDEIDPTNVKVTHLDPLMADVPSVVIGQTKTEIIEMGILNLSVFDKINDVYLDRDKIDSTIKYAHEIENKLDLYEKEISDVNFMIMHKGLVEEEVEITRENLIICDEYETISDYLFRTTKSLKKLIENNIYLDEMRKNTVVQLHHDVESILVDINNGYKTDSKEFFITALKKCNKIKGTYNRARQVHLENLSLIDDQTLLSTAYMDILNNYRRIKEHSYAIIETFIKID